MKLKFFPNHPTQEDSWQWKQEIQKVEYHKNEGSLLLL